ncbi:TPA: L-tyrosine/L-tryptophan isonitrile synthase family protein [Serratia rubidaea]|nr:L-tyrosine/L-tryptophan isonitrile synthase family protein [Serratia rubidaea]HDJ1448182.1 L-tyrosine/L-tryptophan isonitrile synthase family protein [Serratia rubidaea]HDJ1461882.1 L-tyrosine/L-tryptophan isonitrile synthase family protein [Serratia rubidaea]
MEAIDFRFSGNITPITNGHRALAISSDIKNSLYTESEFRKKSSKVSTEFIFEKVVPSLINAMEQNVAHRLTAAAVRAGHNVSLYGVDKAGASEIATEILFDAKLTKCIEKNVNRSAVHQKIKYLKSSNQPLLIGLPLFSRKPVSPIKNRGHLPDIGDIHSIMRCAEIAKLLSWVHDYDIHLSIFADGFKYQRACGTPDAMISDYQASLRFWAAKLGIDKYIKIINYEDAVSHTLGPEQTRFRDEVFLNTYHQLHANTAPLFNPDSLHNSLRDIEANVPHGCELRYIFFSIASSVFYQTSDLGNRIIRRCDLAQSTFAKFLAELHGELQGNTSRFTSNRDVIASLIFEAWDAALKYVAISLTDRKLDVWRQLQPEGIKLTIHGKPGEIQIRPTNSKLPTMTAQHAVGGLAPTKAGVKVTCEYRIEREAAKEIPVLLENAPSHHKSGGYVPSLMRKMIGSEQPFCYVPENVDNIHKLLSGNYTDA